MPKNDTKVEITPTGQYLAKITTTRGNETYERNLYVFSDKQVKSFESARESYTGNNGWGKQQ